MESYSKKMLIALQEEQLAQAQFLLQEAIRKDDEDTLANLGEELLSLGFLEEAKEVFMHLQSIYPEAEGLNLPLAEIAIENNQIEEAFDYLEEIMSDSAYYAQKLLLSADLYQVLGISEVSEAKLKEAYELLPDEPVIMFALGEFYFINQQFSKAIHYYQALIKANITIFSTVSIYERLGNSYSKSGVFEQAIPVLTSALEEKQTDDVLFQLGFTYFQLNDYQKAIALFQQLRLLNPHYQSVYLYLGKALQAEEQLEEAQQVLQEGLKENPYQIEMYQAAAENAYRLHDSEQAEKLLLQALELGENHDDIILTISNLYLIQERFEEMIDLLQQIEEQEHPHVLWNLANAYNHLENFQLAKTYFQQAYQELQHEPEFIKEYGLFLREEGLLDESRQLLEDYLMIEPSDNEILSLLEDLEER